MNRVSRGLLYVLAALSGLVAGAAIRFWFPPSWADDPASLVTMPGPPAPDPGTYPSFEALRKSEADNAKAIQRHEGGELEVVTPDGSRIDLLDDIYATEIDWSHKWAEAIGQSLYYAAVTDRRPRVILLVRDRERERRYYLRALAVCSRKGIRLETREAIE